MHSQSTSQSSNFEPSLICQMCWTLGQCLNFSMLLSTPLCWIMTIGPVCFPVAVISECLLLAPFFLPQSTPSHCNDTISLNTATNFLPLWSIPCQPSLKPTSASWFSTSIYCASYFSLCWETLLMGLQSLSGSDWAFHSTISRICGSQKHQIH
jgi:hypothetical protein